MQAPPPVAALNCTRVEMDDNDGRLTEVLSKLLHFKMFALLRWMVVSKDFSSTKLNVVCTPGHSSCLVGQTTTTDVCRGLDSNALESVHGLNIKYSFPE